MSGQSSLFTLVGTVAFLATFAIVTRPALASDGPKKPSVCADYEIKEGKRGQFAICYDNEKPRTFTAWSVVEVSHPAGGKARYLLGF